VECIGCQIALLAIWTMKNGDVLNNEQIIPLAITSGDVTDFGTIFSSNLAKHFASHVL
jgi:hypothetical protein